MKIGVVVFPGSNCDRDCYDVVNHLPGSEACFLWHKSQDLQGVDGVILPGGFSYGDYLRCGAIARTSPIMRSIKRFADGGGLVLGICNGFQILTEARLLPGVLMRNRGLKFICRDVHARLENNATPFTQLGTLGQVCRIPIAHREGNYFIDEKGLKDLQAHNQIVLRYCSPTGTLGAQHNPNGALDHIAGIINREGNVLGMMPHPERCSETLLGNTAGKFIFASMLTSRLANQL